ncbi:hypothetical protein MBLNU230_g7431t1 [Neophaeotheca triangularis]
MFAGASTGERHHGHLIERWNSSRQRMAEDERRQSADEIQEMDGGWRAEADQSNVSDEESGRKEAGAEEDRGRNINDEDWPLRRDVSPVAEAGAHEDGVTRTGSIHRPQINGSAASSRQSIATRTRGASEVSAASRPGGSSEDGSFAGRTRRDVSSNVSDSEVVAGSSRPYYDSAPISPVLDDGSQRVSAGSRSPNANGLSSRSFSQRRSPSVRTPSDRHVQTPEPSPSSDGVNAAQLTQPCPELDKNSELITHEAPSPLIDGMTTPTVNHGRSGSMIKSTPPRRNIPKQSSPSPYSTTKVAQNRDRVRYSWQSVQDDEPNRPRIHIIKLVSNTATASAGFPQGEAFGFSISPGGRRIAAYNSARLFVLQSAALPVGISQDYALKRRPLAVEIVDDGSVLAVLADEHTVNIYDLSQQQLQRTRTIKLDFPTGCIALAPTGGLLAAAYEGGVEVFSLDANALATDRRAVRSQRMDKLAFSEDGSTLLGTTTRVNVSSTVVVSVPVFPANANGIPTSEELKEAWCSELLHPENIRNSSHAAFMRENGACCNERLYAWDGMRDTFGILNTTDMEYSNIDFPVVISPPLSTCGGLGAAIHSCPAVDEHGDTVAMVVNDRTIRLYIVPHKAEDNETDVEAHSIDHELDEGYGCPINEVRWVHSHSNLPAPLSNQSQIQGRLIATSPGGVMDPSLPAEIVQDLEGGRIILFDFDPQFAGQPGQTFSLTLGKMPPQTLEEEEFDVAQQVELVRRRTINQSKSGGLSQKAVTLGRAASTFNSGRSSRAPNPGSGMFASSHAGLPSSSANRQPRSVLSIHSMQSEATRSLPDLVEGAEAIEEPYANQAPRSQASLQRAATNAQRHRFQSIEERNQERASVDSNRTFLPLPQYTEEPNTPLPGKYRAMAGLDNLSRSPARPSVQTTTEHATPSVSNQGPMTAPASVGENFSAEQAFAVANQTSTMMSPESQRPSHLPRSLQRAYYTAMNPSLLGTGPPPNLVGDWENVRPVGADGTALSFQSAQRAAPVEEDPDAILPVASPGRSSPFGRALENSNRQSPSLLTSAGTVNRDPSSGSSFGGTSMSQQTRTPGSNLPPHMQAFRAAAASASLFPPSEQSDRVPHRQQDQNPGNVAHPITAWHPPSASTPPKEVSGSRHSGKASVANTEKSRKPSWFGSKRGRKAAGESQQEVTGAASRSDKDKSNKNENENENENAWTAGYHERKCEIM